MMQKAVLVRLATIGVDELAELITDAWRCQAPPSLISDFDARGEPGSFTNRFGKATALLSSEEAEQT